MTSIKTIRRAFISYSMQDRDFVERLACDLRKNGIEVWVDFEGLEPGTPDWEAELPDAIEESFAVLLIASPESRKSPYVKGELFLAEAKNLPVYALWAEGENWIDSIPIKFMHMQYLDFRGAAYTDSLSRLLKELSKLGASLPSHFIYESFYSKVLPGEQKPKTSERVGSVYGGSGSYEIYSKKMLHGFMEIRFKDPFRVLKNNSTTDTIFVRPNAFKFGSHLLDELFVNYLRERYPPFSYGQKWHLRHCSNPAQIALDWRTLHDCDFDTNVGTALCEPIKEYGLIPGTVWALEDGMPSYTVVFGAYDSWLIDTIFTRHKAVERIVGKYMSEASPKELSGADLSTIVVGTDFFFAREILMNKIFIQTKECSSDIKKRWTY